MPIDTKTNRREPSPQQNYLSKILTFLFWLLILVNLVLFGEPQHPQVPYSQFMAQVEADKVSRVVISSNQIQYELRSEVIAQVPNKQSPAQPKQIFVTIPVAMDLELPKLLREHKVEFSVSPPSNLNWLAVLLSWIMPPLIFLSIWGWLIGRNQLNGPAALTLGKTKARIYSEGSTGIKFNDVAGVDEAKTELQEIIDFLKYADKYTRLGAKIPKGVLLVGPPGTGKTLLARAIAGEAGVPFFSISGSAFIELFVGLGAARVRDLFEQAKQQAPCIVFIDELDALGRSRVSSGSIAGSNDEREQTLNQLLSELDGFEPNTGVILLAATNRPEVLDPALLRPGRFDRQIVVDRPDKIGREAILRVHARNVSLAQDVDLSKLASRTPGFAGADLANLVNEAALLAARKSHTTVTMTDFNEAIERILTGLEKKSRVLNETEKKTVAYHEVGHALIGALIPGTGTVEKISVVPRGVAALGYTLQLPEEDRFLVTESEIRGRIAALLGGRAAEELIFHEVSTGASDDIQKATDLAERFVTLYGMSQALGPIAFEKAQHRFLEGLSNPQRQVSPTIAETIDREVKDLVDSAHEMALTILGKNQQLLEDTAQKLLAKEVLEGEELRHCLHQVQAPAEVDIWLHTGKLLKSALTAQSKA
ncbi:ATP-dependent zinc metalloprotease FtsH [Scytonema sp. UIC 10036]|uniref:ATP-dependent zinc metalloprotease FtsH n=1 Tax=Scytonema sp. UIC 10036 TaxID=2304196 RepID=UPI0012DA53C5|nr:ATP-dependent zinc metalloprotease FtsH [Scytonema sp. UIC 10036]MUG99593.1 ATP-dependent zinc metalloprotease FtsH [Scytonema sp. UIC 10036]